MLSAILAFIYRSTIQETRQKDKRFSSFSVDTKYEK